MTGQPGGRGIELTLLTPRSPGGVAVVGVLAEDSARVSSTLLRSPGGGPFTTDDAGGPKLALLVCDGEPVDQVLVVDHAGELELHLHGSEAVLAALERCVGPLRAAAVSRADRLLRGAMSDPQLALALEQRRLDLGAFEEDVRARPDAERTAIVTAAIERSRPALALAEPAELVLCGAQNAGKSSLMNRLLSRERVLTGDLAGLTRDPVREQTTLDGYPYVLVDTAGEGETSTDLDARAQELGRHQRRGALGLLVVDGSVGPGEVEACLAGPEMLWVRNKSDLPQAPWPAECSPAVLVSCLSPEAGPTVRRVVGEQLRALRGLPPAGPAGGPAALDTEEFDRLSALL